MLTKKNSNSWLLKKAYKDASKLLPPPQADSIMNIQDALALFKEFKVAWIKAETKLIPAQNKYWYTACVNCQKSVNAEVDRKIKCPSCKEEVEIEARCRVGIILSDETGAINAVIFGQDAEKLIPYGANELKETDEKGLSVTEELANSIRMNTIVCFVRKYETEFKGQSETKYSVVKSYTMGEMVEHALASAQEDVTDADSELQLTEPPTEVTQDNEQMFTPSTKIVLQNIAETIGLPDTSVSSRTRAKRVLSYTDASGDDDCVSAGNPPNMPPDTIKEPATCDSMLVAHPRRLVET